MTDNENVEIPIEDNVEVEEVKDTQEEPMQKPKVKKPRSPAQIESLKKAHLARQEKFAEKKRLMMLEKEEREQRMQKIKEREEQEEQADNEESDEEEVQSPVKKPKPKRKVKKAKKAPKVVFEDSESDEEQEIVIRRVRKNKKEKESVKPSSPINIPVPKENEVLPSVNEIEESIIDKEKKYTHSEILKMMGM